MIIAYENGNDASAHGKLPPTLGSSGPPQPPLRENPQDGDLLRHNTEQLPQVPDLLQQADAMDNNGYRKILSALKQLHESPAVPATVEQPVDSHDILRDADGDCLAAENPEALRSSLFDAPEPEPAASENVRMSELPLIPLLPKEPHRKPVQYFDRDTNVVMVDVATSTSQDAAVQASDNQWTFLDRATQTVRPLVRSVEEPHFLEYEYGEFGELYQVVEVSPSAETMRSRRLARDPYYRNAHLMNHDALDGARDEIQSLRVIVAEQANVIASLRQEAQQLRETLRVSSETARRQLEQLTEELHQHALRRPSSSPRPIRTPRALSSECGSDPFHDEVYHRRRVNIEPNDEGQDDAVIAHPVFASPLLRLPRLYVDPLVLQREQASREAQGRSLYTNVRDTRTPSAPGGWSSPTNDPVDYLRAHHPL
jgi:hypothetical protein